MTQKFLFYRAPWPSSKRTYKCFCEGALATGEAEMYCNIHHWECRPKMGNVNPLVYNKSNYEKDNNEPEARQRRI